MSTRRWIPITLALLMVSVTGPAMPAWAEHEILIEMSKLDPPVLTTTVGERVMFVNRSGRVVHVEFVGDAGQHQIFQIPGDIWAIFHRPGRHAYVVHVSGRGAVDLRGEVEVEEDPHRAWESPACDVTVMGVCIEP